MPFEGMVGIPGDSFGYVTAEQQAGQEPPEVLPVGFFVEFDTQFLGVENGSFKLAQSDAHRLHQSVNGHPPALAVFGFTMNLQPCKSPYDIDVGACMGVRSQRPVAAGAGYCQQKY